MAYTIIDDWYITSNDPNVKKQQLINRLIHDARLVDKHILIIRHIKTQYEEKYQVLLTDDLAEAKAAAEKMALTPIEDWVK